MRSLNRQSGFTLVEIMVVVVIVGIMISVAVLSVGTSRSDKALRDEAQRFLALNRTAQDEAVLQGREFGLEVLLTGYRFVEYDVLGERWAEVPGDELLRLRALDESLEFELYLEDKRILLDADPAQFTDPEKQLTSGVPDYAPHLLIYSSGDTTPFELHIYRALDDQRLVLRGDALGSVEMLTEEVD